MKIADKNEELEFENHIALKQLFTLPLTEEEDITHLILHLL